ncbi:MAG: manganese efflux pump MntP family protein [Coriobacteriales bacterium]|nr:manganese efflux pump MntP family protein [Coriobacteriales bacterium]
MEILELLIIALALSMDAFAVTVSNACCYPDAPRSRLMLMPVVFGVFQGLMPLLGYIAGSLAAALIDRYAGIIAFVILGIIGGKMVWEGVRALRTAKSCGVEAVVKKLSLPAILVQGVATSIDAFVVGVSFLALGTSIAVAAPTVAVVTFACCVAALLVGRRFGILLGDKAEIVGGIVLILIGVKALF